MKNIVARVAHPALAGVLAACSPVLKPEAGSPRGSAAADVTILPASNPPSDWQRVNFVSGLTVAAPPATRVSYPQGEDSRLLEVRAPNFSIGFDNYGPFTGTGAFRLAGRPADDMTRTKEDCRQRVVQIELDRPWGMMSCTPGDKKCRLPNAKVVINSLCKGAMACGTVDTIISSARFAPEPYPPVPLPRSDFGPPEQRVCSVE